jgi:hypothetical protein
MVILEFANDTCYEVERDMIILENKTIRVHMCLEEKIGGDRKLCFFRGEEKN